MLTPEPVHCAICQEMTLPNADSKTGKVSIPICQSCTRKLIRKKETLTSPAIKRALEQMKK